MSLRYCICAYQTAIDLALPDDRVFGEVWRQVSWPGWTLARPSGGHPRLELAARDSQFFLVEEDSVIYRSGQLDRAIRVMGSRIHQLIAETSPLLFVHAGAVVINGSLILLPGQSQAGKTTLTCELCSAGASYLSDEYAVIDPRDSLVHPFARRLTLRTGQEFFPAPVQDPQEIKAVFFLRYRRDQEMCILSPCSRGEATLELFSNTVRAVHWGSSALATLATALQSASCYRGVRSEAFLAVEAILQRLEVQGDNA